MSEWMKKLSLRQRMKGSSRSTMKEDSASAAKPRIGTRSTGRLNLSSSRSPRTVRSATSSPRTPQVARTSRSISPGSPLLNLRTKRARLEKGKETQKTSKPVDTTPKHEEVPSTETSQSGSQNSQSSEGSQSSQNTPKGAGIRTRLSTGSIHMNGTMTVSAAKEKAELDLIMKQISKTDNTSTTKNPASVGKKRTAVPVVVSQDSVLTSDHPPPKKRKIGRNDGSGEDNCNDYFCWLCHKEGTLVCCELCPRVYHTRCLGLSAALPQDWVCPECEKIMRAECVDTRSKAMEMLTIDQLCVLLKYALERMKHAGSEPFQKPVDLNAVPNYFDYIFHPMDLSTLEKNIKKKLYGCTEALLADAKWILHNCIIYNGAHSKLTSSAKMIIKICKHEMNEIELCPDCYLNSCVRKNDDWFSETCRVPHTLVWAKLKGYPFWPSKALREIDGQVDVRFFGAHDRSWVPVSQCFLLSKNIPTSLQRGKKNSGLDMAIEELNLHVKKLRERFGGFEYAPFRTPYDKTDSYKPISQKPELSSNTASIPKSNQTREMKSGNNSSLTSLKPNILRKSAVAKIRNKYSAMVSLKKIDMSPDKTKRKTPLEEDAEKAKSEENYGDLSDKKPESVTFEISKEPNSNEVEKNETAGVSGKIKQVDDQTKGKIIKKSFVSSNLIERIESKLKALEDEPEKELMSVESVDSVNDTNILAVNASDTAALHEKEPLVQSIEKSTEKEIEKDIDKTEKEISELKSAENLLKDNSLGQLSEVGEEITSTPEEQINQNSEEKLKEAESMQISQDKFPENKEPDKSHESVSGHEKDSKTLNRLKLDTLIKSCKEKLGMDNEEAAEIDSALSDDGEYVGSSEEEEDESGNEDASESEDEENSEGSKEVEDTGTESGSVSTEKDDKSEEENSKLHSSCEGNNDGKGRYETSEKDKCVTVSESTTNSGAVSERNENEVKSNILTSKSTLITDSEIAEHNQDKLIDMKSTAMNVKKSDEVAVATVNSEQTQHSERITKDVKQTLNEKKTQSAMSDVSTNSSDGHLNAVVQAECKTTVHTEKGSTSLSTLDKVKNLESFSGALSDRTSIDEDSDTDRLVIDLEEISPKKQSKIEKKEESRQKSGSKCDTVVEKIRKEMDKIQNSVPNCSPDSKNKIESTTGQDKVYRESAESETQKDKSVSLDSKRLSKEGVVESLSTKCRRESKESESSTQSKTSVERNQCFESTNTVKPKVSGEFTRSKVSANTTQTEEPKGMSKCKTQSKQSGDTSQCKESTGKIMLKESADMTKSNEDTEVVVDDDDDDNMEVLDDLSTLPLDSDLPVNTNSSLPDKNFVKPPITDVSEHVPTGSKVAEKFSQKLLKTIQETMDEMYAEVMKEKNDGKTIEMLNKTLSQAKWDYCQELNELKHNFQLTMFEMKAGWESEKEQIVKALNAKHQAEKELAIKETKKKQWCAQCGKEAIFYCCWNTSYCDYPCQQSHWPQHMHTCLQTNKDKTASTTTSASQGSQSQTVSQSASSTPSSVGPSVTSQSSGSITTPAPEPDHLRQLQDNISRAIHREEEKRGESRPGVSPKFSSPMSSPVMQNIRQPGSGQMMFNMQPSAQPGVMQQLQRTRFMGQQMAMQVQQRASLAQSQQGNPRMLFSQPLIQHAVYPLQVQQPQPIGGTILFQNAQQMSYGMPPRPY